MKTILLMVLLMVNQVLAKENFDDLLKSVQEESTKDLQKDKQREKAFLEAEGKARKILDKTQSDLKYQMKKSETLSKEIDDKEKLITKVQGELERSVGDLGEFFGVVRQVSGEVHADFENSLISIHYPNRAVF